MVQFQLGYNYAVKLVYNEKPEDFEEKPKDLIFAIDAAHIVEMETFLTFSTFSAMIFVGMLVSEALGAYVLHDWKFRGF